MSSVVKFKSKAQAEQKSPFAEIVAARVEAEIAWRELNTPSTFKLSPGAMLKEALAIAHADEKDLATLKAALESATGLEATKATLRKFILFIKSPNCARPTAELRKLDFLLRPFAPETIVELASIRATTFLLFALGVQIAGEKSPESFGTAESSRAVDQQLIDLAVKRDDLNKQIAEGFTADDLVYGPVDQQGRCVVSFKLGGGKITIYPKENAGERLANWIMTNQP